MRRGKTKIIVFLVIMSFITACFSPFKAKAVTFSEIRGINYSRIYMDIRDYEVIATVGGYNFPGKITRTANFDEKEINKYISLFMERNHVYSDQLEIAEKTVKDAINKTEYEQRQLLGDMAQTIAGIIGGDLAEVTVAGIRGNIENALFVSDTIKNSGWQALFTGKNIEQFFTNQYQCILEKYGSLYNIIRNGVDLVTEDLIKKYPPVKAVLTAWDAGKFCYDAYKRYEKMLPIWERAFAAKAFLDDFYRRLNIFLDNMFKDRAEFVLTVNGDKTREFTFLGTKSNFQLWQVSFLLKRERSYGNRKYSPAGEYRGSASIVLSHTMWGFDMMLWELPVGPFEEFWFTKATALILNGVQVVKGDTSGWSYISRVIESKDARLTVYADEGNGSGKVRLMSTMDMSNFKDTIITSSTQKASMDSSVGFAGGDSDKTVAAAMWTDVKLHLEGNEFGTFDMVLDHANAKFNSVFGINVDEKQGTRLITRVWDSNIWAPLQNKTAKFDIRANILEKGFDE